VSVGEAAAVRIEQLEARVRELEARVASLDRGVGTSDGATEDPSES